MKLIRSTQSHLTMDHPTLTTMVVLYTMGVKLDTNVLAHELPLTADIIKVEKQGIVKRGSSKRDLIKRRAKTSVPKRTTGFGHNSITMVVMSAGDGTLLRKEITVKIFQNGVFHITGVLDEKYDRHVTRLLKDHIEAHCPAARSGEWTDVRRVVLMNYKTKLTGATNISRDALYASLREKGVTTVYEPAVYPAVKVYFPKTKWIAKVFRTGQIILTGMTTHDECASLMTQLKPLLLVNENGAS
jgi:TATA-box binding protein (TBP) (component of TFIID and TFIIIB)